MNFRKNSVLIIGCSLAGLLLVVAIFFLVKNQGDYRANLASLKASQNRLEQLNTRDPFPAVENITVAQQNLDFLKQKFDTIHQTLVREQLQAETIEPARFAQLLEQAARRAYTKATDQGVILPANLGLGFKAYAEGKLPPNNPATMERLVLQVKAIEDIASLMIDAKIQSIDAIQREEFEVKADAAAEQSVSGRDRGRPVGRATQTAAASGLVGGIPASPTNSMYTVERLVFNITGWESSIWEVLNRLASHKVVYVLADVTMDNTKLDLGKPVDMKAKLAAMTAAARSASTFTGGAPSAGVMPEPTLDSISREDRVVGGREPIKAKIVVDMYRFLNGQAAEVQP